MIFIGHDDIHKPSKVDPIIVEKLTSVRASCSLNPTTPVTPCSNESVECFLYIDDIVEGNTIHVANGRVYLNEGVIHFSSLEEGNARVSVSGVLVKKAKLPIPTEEALTVEDAMGGFVSWPRRLIETETTAKESRGPPKLESTSQPTPDDNRRINYKVIYFNLLIIMY